jgi:hypothetical protein
MYRSVVVAGSGTYSSMTRWALVPLKPKELTAARRGTPSGASQGSRSVFR